MEDQAQKSGSGGSVDLIPRDNRKDSYFWKRLVKGYFSGSGVGIEFVVVARPLRA